MQIGLEEFASEADLITTSFEESLRSRKPPPIVYHYTDDLGLKGILESGQLWLSDISSLNDPSELNHGFSIAIDVLARMVANGPPERPEFARRLKTLAERRSVQGVALFLVCSFSFRGDDLGQWRAYADNGRGYALGFDTAALEAGFTKGGTADSYSATFPVTYSDTELAEMHRQIIDKMQALISLPHGRKLEPAAIKSYLTDLSVSLMTHIAQAALFFKHEAYDNEQEYRFFEMYAADAPPHGLKQRLRPYSLIKYKEFQWRSVAPSALRQIVVGPAAVRTKAIQFARDCVSSFHSGAVPVTCSPIPYRAV